MTSARIKQAALAHFAHKGYEGASLADIAGEVGIKKQSIYTHFKGKDELFLELYRDIYKLELEFASRYFQDPAPPPVDEFLYRFLVRCRERYEQDDHTKFFLRVSFFPPPHLHEEIGKLGCQYVDTLESLLLPSLRQAVEQGKVSPAVGIRQAAAAFASLLDGLFVEMLFGGPERSMNRLEASWLVYWRGLRFQPSDNQRPDRNEG